MPEILPVHPYTGLRAVGIVGGRPVWPILGGDGNGDGGSAGTGGSAGDGGSGQPTGGDNGAGQNGGQPDGQNGGGAGNGNAGDAGQNAGQNAGQSGGQTGGQQGGQSGGGDDDLASYSQADLAKMVRDLRNENGKSRTNAKEQAATEAKQNLAQDIGKALGLVKEDEPADPDKLAQQLSSEQQRAKDSAVELAVYKNASKHGADPDALTDSRAFLNKVAELDPNDERFGEKVGDAIKKATENNPKLRAQGQAPPRSSGQHAGGTGGNTRPKSMTEALNRHYNQ